MALILFQGALQNLNYRRSAAGLLGEKSPIVSTSQSTHSP